MEDQHSDNSRLRNWKKDFSNSFKKIERCIDTVPSVAKDAAYIRLTEFSNQIEEWEHKLICYDTEHKTDVFHDFHDFKTKLLIQLDSFDVTSIPKIKTDRSKLYGQVEKLSREFDQKIHRGHHTCPFCVQVKEVVINL